jgi:hypothetical protein
VGFNTVRGGHGDTLIPSIGITKTPEVSRDTPAVVKPVSNILNIESSGNTNVLNSYRSYTYNFTLSAVSIKKANDPENYRKSSQDFVILKSGGKGSQGLTGDVTGSPMYRTDTSISTETSDGDGFKVRNKTTKVLTGFDRQSAQKLVQEFNKKSPGRFDMYIDNVEITTIMAPNKAGGLTLPTNVSFDVFEPYSINGFIEALQVSAQAAGYDVYSNASFLLKIDFIGYKDDVDLPKPESIPNTSRYFLIRFTGMSIEVTENGTKYSCTAVPFADKGFGEEGKIQSSASMTGSKVGSALKNLMEILSNRINTSEATNKDDTESDSYEIKFPKWNAGSGWDLKSEEENEIAGFDISYGHKGGDLVRFIRHDAVSTTTSIAEALGTTSTAPTIQFKEGDNIHDIITATIRDSAYVRTKLDTIGQTGNPDSYGRVKYFLIRLHVENKEKINSPKGRPYQKFTYIVTEHYVHYTFIPTYGNSQNIDKSKLKTLVLRDYNYIYTGKNVDITSFKLDYNYLYFEAIPKALGRNNDSSLANATSKSNAKEEIRTIPIDTEAGRAETASNSERNKVQVGNEITGNQPNSDPYTAMAKNMHLALVNSVSRVSGDLEIIGDPFYLVTGGIGNYNPKPSETQQGVTKDNEADRFYGQLLVSLTFKNPIDIDERTGSLKFEPSSADASGVFMVTEATSSFREGLFKQKLKIIRVPGQLPDGNKITNPADSNITDQDPSKQAAPVADVKINPFGVAAI